MVGMGNNDRPKWRHNVYIKACSVIWKKKNQQNEPKINNTDPPKIGMHLSKIKPHYEWFEVWVPELDSGQGKG